MEDVPAICSSVSSVAPPLSALVSLLMVRVGKWCGCLCVRVFERKD